MAFIFHSTFEVAQINPEGRKYLRVSRLECKSKLVPVTIAIDINSDIFPVTVGEHLTIGLTSTLNVNGEEERDVYDHSVFHRETAMSSYDYVMHGRVYKCNCDDLDQEVVTVLISFGGLLMKVEGTTPQLRDIQFNKNYYVLIKKTN
jgi:DNA-directed RNA polymerase I, II, and III subunit RPABC3